MLAKKFCLIKDSDFKEIFSRGKFLNDNLISLVFLINNLGFSRLAIIISSKVIKPAVKRNLIKRRLRHVWQLLNIKSNLDVILIIKSKDILKEEFEKLKERINFLLSKIRIN